MDAAHQRLVIAILLVTAVDTSTRLVVAALLLLLLMPPLPGEPPAATEPEWLGESTAWSAGELRAKLEAALPGATLIVAAGTFALDARLVVAARGLTLIGAAAHALATAAGGGAGAGAAATPVRAGGGDEIGESVLSCSGDGYFALDVRAKGVTVKGLRISGGAARGGAGATAPCCGLRVRLMADCCAEGCALAGKVSAAAAGASGGAGADAAGAAGAAGAVGAVGAARA